MSTQHRVRHQFPDAIYKRTPDLGEHGFVEPETLGSSVIGRTENMENGDVEIAARKSKSNGVVRSLRMVHAGITRKINCFCLLVAYADAETMVPPRALVTCNPRSGLRVIAFP